MDYSKFRKSLIREANKNGYRHEAEDFAQWALEKVLGGRKATCYQFFIDYVRAQKPTVPYDQNVHGSKPKVDLLEINNLLSGADKVSRACLVLNAMWGLTEKEIGYCFNLSEASICLKIRALKKMIRERETQQ